MSRVLSARTRSRNSDMITISPTTTSPLPSACPSSPSHRSFTVSPDPIFNPNVTIALTIVGAVKPVRCVRTCLRISLLHCIPQADPCLYSCHHRSARRSNRRFRHPGRTHPWPAHGQRLPWRRHQPNPRIIHRDVHHCRSRTQHPYAGCRYVTGRYDHEEYQLMESHREARNDPNGAPWFRTHFICNNVVEYPVHWRLPKVSQGRV